LEYSAKLAGSRALEDFFGANFTAMMGPKGHPERLAYIISDFIEEARPGIGETCDRSIRMARA
jgi:hypothetical protein